jgi:hypothetical protein
VKGKETIVVGSNGVQMSRDKVVASSALAARNSSSIIVWQ